MIIESSIKIVTVEVLVLHITHVLKDFEPHHESMFRVEGWVGGGFMCVHLRSLQLFGVAGGGNIHFQKVTRVGLGKA